ncbi:unnamed protein product [Clonostachys rosea]|uniref:Carrier domain-containing protein n=1 Tax=Bionectria ochroleuca TaxID=29856 RepID=A0ABY6U591_BIOOC|nr:unnamed protein product [Clonostachys rosea]
MATLISHLDSTASHHLPTYMIPTFYIPLAEIPRTGTGKTDRRRLREIVAKMSLEELASLNPTKEPHHEPSTVSEHKIRQLWASTLGIDYQTISTHSSFFRIGGNSIAAIRLVAAASTQGYSMSVADVFHFPRLTDLANRLVLADPNAFEAVLPFNRVLDVFPCTELQMGLLSMTAKQSNSYVARHIFRLPPDSDLSRLQEAWKRLVDLFDIIRTRIVDVPGLGLVQAICSNPPPTFHGDSLSTYIASERNPMGLGTSLTYSAFINDRETDQLYFVLVIHHALFDGWSLRILLNALVRAYGEADISPPVPFQNFIKFNSKLDSEEAANYWRSQLEGCEAASFPRLPTPAYQPYGGTTISHTVTGLSWPRGDITAPNIIRAAWSILQARHSDSTDVVFGVVASGRQAPVPGISWIAGPTIATVPVRVRVDKNTSAIQLLTQVQCQSVDMLPYEQFGLCRIRSLGEVEAAASGFQTLLVIQPREDTQNDILPVDKADSVFLTQVEAESTPTFQQFNTYALTVIINIYDEGFDIVLSFDSKVLAVGIAERMAKHLGVIAQQLCDTTRIDAAVSDIKTSSVQDLTDIWSWNASVPETIELCVHELFDIAVKRQPEAPAVCAWDGSFTYQQLDNLSTILAHHLTARGIGPGDLVPLFFEKSRWTPVAMLGVMKAGAASVAVDTSHPPARLFAIAQQAHNHSKKRLVLSSILNERLARDLVVDAIEGADIIVAEIMAQQTDNVSVLSRKQARVVPDDLLYVCGGSLSQKMSLAYVLFF